MISALAAEREGDESAGANERERWLCMTVRPLTCRNTEGEVYRRLSAVEKQIIAALALEACAWVERARIQDVADEAYLQEEALVYLIREARRGQYEAVTNDLVNVLIDRCAVVLAAKLGKLGPDLAALASDEVFSDLVVKIVDLDSDAGDYFQVRFWLGLDRLAISAFHRYRKQLALARDILPLSALAGQEIELQDPDDAIRSTGTSTDYQDDALTPEQIVLCEDALLHLPEPIRSAYVLRYSANWPVESQDPEVPSLSEWFGVTPRAIRKWFTKAEKILESWRGA